MQTDLEERQAKPTDTVGRKIVQERHQIIQKRYKVTTKKLHAPEAHKTTTNEQKISTSQTTKIGFKIAIGRQEMPTKSYKGGKKNHQR